MLQKESLSRKIFIIFNYIFCCTMALLCIVPLVHILAISLSDAAAVDSGQVFLWPIGFNLESYKYVIGNNDFLAAFLVSIKRTVLGVSISMFLSVLAGYPLSRSKHKFHARPFYVVYFMITMIMSGGLIPTYLLIANLGFIDTIWALVLPTAMNISNIILLQNYIKGLPDELVEAAYADGAGHWTTLWKVILPLCKPVLATLVLFKGVAHWNTWFDGLIYMNNPENYPLQSYLQTVVVNADIELIQNIDEALMENITQRGNKTAQIFVAMIPILLVYPFVQKHFTGGIVMGSVKG